MPALKNPKWERFCQELATGRTAEEAHRVAGYKASRSGASQLRHRPEISGRISEILTKREAAKAQVAVEAVKADRLTKEWVIERLIQNVDKAMQHQTVKDAEGNSVGEYKYDGSVANKALELLGKEVGMFIDRKEIRTGHLDELPADSIAELREQLVAARARRADSGSGQEAARKPH